ncbi:hypothetical protein [Streptomyces sp. NPDC058718]|uniref:hypothetical protein n=1 Tax=Streptomyces sp. NPDC058718 TaxID=3346610 RepID=UPI003694A327
MGTWTLAKIVMPSRWDNSAPRGGSGVVARRVADGRDPSVREAEDRSNRLKQWRGIATRYEKTATIYLAVLHIAGIFLWSAC